MKALNDLEYLKLNKFRRFFYKFCYFFATIPDKFVRLFKQIGNFFVKIGLAI